MSSTPWHDPAAPDPFSVWHGVHARVAHLLRHPDQPGFAAELDAVTEVILNTVDAAPEAGLFEMIYGEEIAGYAIAHSLQTAFVTALVAQRLQWSVGDQQTLVKASLTMNISMLELQDTLVRQPTPPTLKQRHEIETHAERSGAMLRAAGIEVDATVVARAGWTPASDPQRKVWLVTGPDEALSLQVARSFRSRHPGAGLLTQWLAGPLARQQVRGLAPGWRLPGA